jgi:hypothetical protein
MPQRETRLARKERSDGGIVALPSMSSATIIGAAIFRQLIASMVIDHFGWFNVPAVPINTSRIIGAVLLLIGAILMGRIDGPAPDSVTDKRRPAQHGQHDQVDRRLAQGSAHLDQLVQAA